MKDGRIAARKVTAYLDSGAYTRLSSYMVVKCAAHIPGPYTIPNVSADVFCVYTNRTPATVMRGSGATALDFAIECQMDKGATAVGMDPLEYRILNAYRDGDMKAHRREAKNCALIECAQVAAEKANWPLRDEFRKMSSRNGGGATRSGGATDRTRAPTPPAPTRASKHPAARLLRATGSSRAAASTAAPKCAATARRVAGQIASYGAQRFSSVFGTRRR